MSQNNVAIAERPSGRGSVEPKIATVGMPSSAARCIVPVSFVSSRRHWAQLIDQLLKSGLPDRFMHESPSALVICSPIGASFFFPNKNPLHGRSCGNCRGCFSESAPATAFGRSVFCAWGESDSYY